MIKSKEREVQWHNKTCQISQVPSEGLEYAFLSENYVQVHQLVWCKDFMQDAIHGHLNNKFTEIYGFTYDPVTDPPLYMEQTRLLLANWKDAKFGDKITNNVTPFLQAIENQLKMAKTVFEKCINPPPRYKKSGVYIAHGSKRWMRSPPLISLYTLLLRVGFVHNPKDDPLETIRQVQEGHKSTYYKTNDRDILNNARAGLDRILRQGDRKTFHQDIRLNYPAKTASGSNVSIYTVHDGCGLTAFTQGSTKTQFPHWHRLEGQ
jgi:hypothetical protein